MQSLDLQSACGLCMEMKKGFGSHYNLLVHQH